MLSSYFLKVSCPQSHSAQRGQTVVSATMSNIHDTETHLSLSELTHLSPMNVELKFAMTLIIMGVENERNRAESGKGEKQEKQGRETTRERTEENVLVEKRTRDQKK